MAAENANESTSAYRHGRLNLERRGDAFASRLGREGARWARRRVPRKTPYGKLPS